MVEVGPSCLGLGFGGLQGRMGGGCQVLEAIPALPAMFLHLPPEDTLAQLLCVLQNLQEAHSSILAGPPSREPHHLLELQT